MLTAALTTAYVTAVQARQVMATMKHFVAYTQETGRSTGHDVTIDDRTLNEVDTISFASAIVKAGLSAVMCSYNKINGPHATANRYLITDVMKQEWGWDGLMMSDWGAVHETAAVINANLGMPHWSTVKRAAAVLDVLTMESGDVTPKLSIRRDKVITEHRPILEALYREEEAPPQALFVAV